MNKYIYIYIYSFVQKLVCATRNYEQVYVDVRIQKNRYVQLVTDLNG